MKNIGILILSLLPCLGHSQEYTTISGRIIDQETKEPLPFSTIGIHETQIGVVANQDGLFDLTFPNSYSKDSLTTSMVGYESSTVKISSLLDQDFVEFAMKTKHYVLPEVIVVSGEELSAEAIVELVRKSIPEHYPQKHFEMEAFYRDYKIEDGECVGLLEASVTISDKGYRKAPNPYSMQEKVKLNQVRKSLNDNFKANMLVNYNIMKGFLSLNDIRYRHRWLSKRFKKEYEYEKVGYSTINDRLMYLIRCTSSNWIFKVYVDAENYLVPKIEMEYTWEDGVFENEWTLYDSIRLEQRWAKEILEFQEIDGKWLPKFHIFNSESITYDLHTNEQLVVSQVRQEFLVNHVDLTSKEKIEKAERMNQYEAMHLQVPAYDPEFWKNYNVIKLNPRDEKLIQGLEEKMKLEDQFSATNQ